MSYSDRMRTWDGEESDEAPAKRPRAEDPASDLGAAGPLDPAKLVAPPPETAKKRFQCEQCEYSTERAGHFNVHVKGHLGVRPYPCSGCDKSYKLKQHLETHYRSKHSGEKPYACSYDGCLKQYADSRHLAAHSVTHGPKLHKCLECGRSFHLITNLHMHERIHTGEKLYSCDECGMRFTQPQNVKIHQRTHTGDTPYECLLDGCNERFKQSSSLYKHTKRFHYEEYAARRKQQESIVEDLLAPAFPPHTFVREHRIDNVCLGPDLLGDAKKYARADFMFPYTLRHDTCVMLEVDEHGHADYIVKCETARMYNQVETLRAEGNTQKFVFVRYNPHAFKVDGVTLRTGREERHKELLRVLRAIADGPADAPDVRVVYLFYDRDAAGRPDVLDDPDYDETVASWWCAGV